MKRIANILTLIVAGLVLAIGAGAFMISYEALKQTGLTGGIPAPLGWLWPLLIDAPLIVFTLALLVSQIMRQSVKLWAGLVILYTLATVGFNLTHAQPTPLGWTVAIVAPIGLLLTTEALRHLAKVMIDRAAAIQTLAELTADCDNLISQRDNLGGDLDKLNGQIEAAAVKLESIKSDIKASQNEQKHRSGNELTAAKLAKIGQRRDKVLAMLAEGMDPADIANELEVKVRTIKRDIVALNGKVKAIAGGSL